MLKQTGPDLIDEAGNRVMLRGVGLGGWMNMENFITGFPGNEEGFRAAVAEELGTEKAEFFFDRFLEHFFGADDAAYLESLGLNLVRIALNYRHLESDADPFVVKESGFKHLDRVIELCARHRIYTIIDLHAVQGYQNSDWHSDNPTHRAFLWTHRQFQDRATNLWRTIAERYRDQEWVAGYNLINEPNAPDAKTLLEVTRRIFDAIREVDPKHLIFLDANHYGSDFSDFGDPWAGTVYSAHDYALCGFPGGGPYPGYTGDVWCDRAWLEKHFFRKAAYSHQHDVPIWIGEFGPVYSGDPELDDTRFVLARDQVEMYDHHNAHWAIWTYKDIGLQGLVYASSDSPWMRLLSTALDKKTRLATDMWGSVESNVADVMIPLKERLNYECPGWRARDYDGSWLAERLVRSILFAEALLPEFAPHFKGLTEEKIDDLMHSFALKNCVKRERLADVLSGSRERVSAPA